MGQWVRPPKILAAVGMFLGAASVPSTVHAQHAAQPGAALVTLSIFSKDARTPLTVSLYPVDAARSAAPIANCVTPCAAAVPTGKYRIAVAATEETLSGSTTVTIRSSQWLALAPGEKTTKDTGLALGIVGPVLFLTGLAVTAASLSGYPSVSKCSEETYCPTAGPSEASQVGAIAGVTMLIVGTVLTPIGWIMFANAYGLGIGEGPARAARRVAPTLGLVPVHGGAVVGGGFAF